ncbi:MAG: cupin domain-containing protein [Bdellovibrionales bacterium]|nr:cupin domain-containing protein [Bdellovibrionales bacterium]
MSAATANELIEKLGLKPLPEEGGYYKETYRHVVGIPAEAAGISRSGSRRLATAIYYVVVPSSFSALHLLQKSDEIFHFYGGDPVEMIQIDPQGKLHTFVLGADVMAGESPQVVVPGGNWQALRLKEGGAWALMGTTVSPGFEFEDFELKSREELLKLFPQHRDAVLKFTRAEGERIH